MDIDELVDRYYDCLNNTDKMIWKYISNNREEVANSTISELSNACYVSRATIMRFTQKLSLSGYAELKTLLKHQLKKQYFSSSDDLTFLSSIYAQVGSDIEQKDLSESFKHIQEADHVYVVSSGIIQHSVAMELIRLFTLTGDYFVDLKGAGETSRIIPQITKNDVFIFISLSGEKEEILALARKLKIKGTYLIAFTKFKNNTLATIVDENVYILTANLPLKELVGFDYESITSYYFASEMFFLKYQIFKKKLVRGEN